MKITLRARSASMTRLAGVALAGAAFSSPAARAQDYPNTPIRFTLGYPVRVVNSGTGIGTLPALLDMASEARRALPRCPDDGGDGHQGFELPSWVGLFVSASK